MFVVHVILVTGSRFFDDIWAIKTTLDQALTDATHAGAHQVIIRHGACYPPPDRATGRRPHRSADYLTRLWVAHNAHTPTTHNLAHVLEQERPADWTAPCRPACQQRTRRDRVTDHRRIRGNSMICPMAGLHRNTDMIREQPQPTVGIAFTRDNSAGTAHCIRAMRAFSIPVTEVPFQVRELTA